MARVGRISGLTVSAIVAALAMAAPAAAQYSPGYQFMEAVKKGDGSQVGKLLQDHSKTLLDTRDITTGETALHITVRNMDLLWTRFLIQQGANVNIRDNRGVTPLVLAAQTGFLDGVDTLISAGARVDVPNATGETPLISAVHRRDIPIMRSLLKGGADPDRADSSGRSARDYAMLDPRSSQLIAEIDKHAQPTSQREGGATYGPSF